MKRWSLRVTFSIPSCSKLRSELLWFLLKCTVAFNIHKHSIWEAFLLNILTPYIMIFVCLVSFSFWSHLKDNGLSPSPPPPSLAKCCVSKGSTLEQSLDLYRPYFNMPPSHLRICYSSLFLIKLIPSSSVWPWRLSTNFYLTLFLILA